MHTNSEPRLRENSLGLILGPHKSLRACSQMLEPLLFLSFTTVNSQVLHSIIWFKGGRAREPMILYHRGITTALIQLSIKSSYYIIITRYEAEIDRLKQEIKVVKIQMIIYRLLVLHRVS